MLSNKNKNFGQNSCFCLEIRINIIKIVCDRQNILYIIYNTFGRSENVFNSCISLFKIWISAFG